MISTKTPVTGKVAVWALPTSEWERNRDPALGVFKYVMRTDSPYQQGAVKVQEYDVTLTVPAGVDLLQRAVATLMEAKDKVLGDAQREATAIQQQINSLLLLGGPKPDANDLIGEAVQVPEFLDIPDGAKDVACSWPEDCECPECSKVHPADCICGDCVPDGIL